MEKVGHSLKVTIVYGFLGSGKTTFLRSLIPKLATHERVAVLVNEMGEIGAGIFEIAGEATGRDPERQSEYLGRLRDLAVESGRPITWGMFASRRAPDMWRPYFDMLDETADAGGRMFAQVHSRALNVLLSFKTQLPFDRLPVWSDLRALPLDEQAVKLRDPEIRQQLVEIANGDQWGMTVVDHRSNPRHPSHWHVRGYGLFTANPFGLHDFTGDDSVDASLTIDSGEAAVFRYRLIIHPERGIDGNVQIEALIQEFHAN